jgi:hypothetical protein
MTTAVGIKDSKTKQQARVTRFGQLVVAPLDYSEPIKRDLDTIDTAFNFLVPVSKHSIVITDIIVSADKGVSPTDPAEIEIYQADAVDSLDESTSIVSPRLSRGEDLTLTGLNWLVPEGKWINAKTNDNNVLITIASYRVPVDKV